jgi:hypothetical protein
MEVDPELLLHRSLVFDHQDSRAEHLGRPVHLEPRRQRRKLHLAVSRTAVSQISTMLGFSKVSTYMILNKNS